MRDRIVIDPAIAHGKPVIRGTRVPVVIVLGGMAAGMSADEVAHEYGLSIEDIRAALSFAGECIDEESFHSLPTAAE